MIMLLLFMKGTNKNTYSVYIQMESVFSLQVRQDDIKQEGAMDLKYLQGHK